MRRATRRACCPETRPRGATPGTGREWLAWPAAIICAALAGCQTLPPPPPEVIVRTVTNTVSVPTPVPCFAEADRPKLPEVMKLPDSATPDQRAAALEAFKLDLEKYAADVDALFILCQSVGAKP
jgi:hypothetical protein